MSAHTINLRALSDDVLLEWWRRWYERLNARGGSWFVISAQIQAAAMLAEIDTEIQRRGISHDSD